MDKIDQLKDLLNDDPSNSFIQFALAKEYEKLDNPTKALEYFDLLMNENPDYIGCYYHYAKCLETLNKVQRAKEIYALGITKALAINDVHSCSELRSALLNLELEEL